MSATNETNGTTDLDPRDVLALTQYLTVLDDLPPVADDDDRYVVVSQSGAEYLVDLGEGTCTCPDFRYRGGRCKHIRRVEFATGVREIPRWIDSVDPDLGRHLHDPAGGGPRFATEFPAGAVVRDRRHPERGARMRVIRELDVRADDYEIEPGRTVADYNPDENPSDHVVEVVFEGDLDRHVPGWREWPDDDLVTELARYREEWGVGVRTYAFPSARLEREMIDA
ncbi:MAG: SWIM zinc finger family protein [archaeon]